MRARSAAVLFALVFACLAGAARAELALCNRTSYALEAALAVVEGGATAVQGWTAVEPGACAVALQGELPAGRLFLHARAKAFYAAPALTPESGRPLCVSPRPFVRAGDDCSGPGDARVPFLEVRPRQKGARAEVDIADADDLSLAAARMAGVQRLLTMAGHDARPIDGERGARTEAALARFRKDKGLPAEAEEARVFAALLAAAEAGPGLGLVWCNETRHQVLAAFAEEEGGRTLARGWFRVAPAACLRATADFGGARLFSYAEAVDGADRPIALDGKPLRWAGSRVLCTRPARFEIAEHANCVERGYDTTPFAPVDTQGRAGTVIRFREP